MDKIGFIVAKNLVRTEVKGGKELWFYSEMK